MTDTNPQPDYVSNTDPAPQKSKGKLIGGIAALAVVAGLAGGGVYAYSMLASSDDYPYNHMASGAFVYGQTNIDPDADQKLALRELLKKYPELEEQEGLNGLTVENANGVLVRNILEADTDEDFDWVGDRVAFAGYPDDSDEDTDPELAVLMEAKDVKAGEAALKSILADLNADPVYGGEEEQLTEVPVDPAAATPASYTTGGTTEQAPEDEWVGQVYDEKWIAITDGNLAELFEADSTLADDSAFTDDFDQAKGTVAGFWVDLEGFGAALETDGEEAPTMSGTVTARLEARKDGLDLIGTSKGVKLDGEVVGPQGDAGELTELLSANAYEDELVSLGIAGLGESAQRVLEADMEDATGFNDEFDPADLPGLLGSEASLSVKGDRFENLEGKLVLQGIDQAVWERYLEQEGVTVDMLEQEIAAGTGREAEFVLEDGLVSLQFGAAPEGGQTFEEGQVTGSLNLDDLASLIHNFTLFGEQPEGEAPTGLGTITLHSTMDDEGNGENVVSWVTGR